MGGGPAGVSAAEASRTNNGDARVHIVTADSDRPYARPPLSKDYLRGETEDVALHPEQWYGDRSIELISDLHVDRIDLQSRRVVAGDTHFDYMAVVLACGAMPAALTVPGGESAVQLRSLTDAQRLRQAAVDADAAGAIRAGVIRREDANAFARRGGALTIVDPPP